MKCISKKCKSNIKMKCITKNRKLNIKMKCISKNCKLNINKKVFEEAEKTYSIAIKPEIKEFLKKNSGGYPIKEIIVSDGEEYEVRVFMSIDASDENYYIRKPMDYFLKKTKGKIIPIGIDSGDNYYCVNNETGKVYYWSAGEDLYYCIAKSIDEFITLFENVESKLTER